MSGAHYALAWAACIVAIGLPVGIIMAIKLQEDRELRCGGEAAQTGVDGDVYLRRYRFLWASIPMALLLLALVALPIAVCGSEGCGPNDVSTLFQLVSLVVGLFAWSLMISLIYNRYFHSTATRPFRLINGAERRILRASQFLGGVAIMLMLIGALR